MLLHPAHELDHRLEFLINIGLRLISARVHPVGRVSIPQIEGIDLATELVAAGALPGHALPARI